VNALNHAREAWGYNVAAATFLAEGESSAAALRYQGQLARIQGHSAKTAAYTSGFADLLSLVPSDIGQAAGGGALKIPAGRALNSPYQGFGSDPLPSGLTVGEQYYKYQTGYDSLTGVSTKRPAWWK
jgi:hypothetical protein